MVSGISIWQLIILIVMFAVAVVPWVLVLASKKVRGGEKFLWFLVAFFFSWLGYLAFFLIVSRKREAIGLNVAGSHNQSLKDGDAP